MIQPPSARLRTALLASTLAAVGSAAAQQPCYEPQLGGVLGSGDDVVLPMQSLGFAFPFAGGTWTDVHVSTNGFVHLSNGGVPAHTGALCCQGSTTQLVLGGPKLCPFWSDLDVPAASGAVRFQALPGRAVITWENVVELGDPTAFSMQLQLAANGTFVFAWDHRCAVRTGGNVLVGWSPGNGAAVPSASDFATPGFAAATTGWEVFALGGAPFDLAGASLVATPGAGGFAWTASPCAAGHTAYGDGCDSFFASCYEHFATAAANDLAGLGMAFLPAGGAYTVGVSAAGFVAPSAAAAPLVLGDDAQVTLTLPAPFPAPGGAVTQLTVCSNGFVTLGGSGNGTGYAPDPIAMLQAPQPAFWSWHDYDPTSPGSGAVRHELVGSLYVVTWANVHSYGASAGDTVQFQFDLASGAVHLLWPSLAGLGNGYLVGFSPAGASADPGSRDLSTSLATPFVLGATDLLPLQLTAAPRPVVGATVTWTTARIPEFAPGSGLHVALHVVALQPLAAPGLDLGFFGAPGCAALLASLDVTTALVGTTPTQGTSWSIPATAPLGFELFAQSLALFVPGSLPNGQNPAGLTTSNAVASRLGAW